MESLNEIVHKKSFRQVFLFSIFLISQLPAFGQTDDSFTVRQRPLLKLGAFVYPYNSRDGTYSTHLELELPFRNKPYLTFGPRIDHCGIAQYKQNNIYLGIQLKFYPTYWIRHIAYRGVFVGIEPLMLLNSQSDQHARYGPGIGTLLGYQYLFKNNIALGFEADMIYVQNLNKDSRQYPNYHHPSERYFYFLASIKVGFKL